MSAEQGGALAELRRAVGALYALIDGLDADDAAPWRVAYADELAALDAALAAAEARLAAAEASWGRLARFVRADDRVDVEMANPDYAVYQDAVFEKRAARAALTAEDTAP